LADPIVSSALALAQSAKESPNGLQGDRESGTFVLDDGLPAFHSSDPRISKKQSFSLVNQVGVETKSDVVKSMISQSKVARASITRFSEVIRNYSLYRTVFSSYQHPL
jgi:hypothetical protein